MKNTSKELTQGVDIKDKLVLTPAEWNKLTGLSYDTLEKMIEDSNSSFLFYVGTHKKIKRVQFEEYLKDLKFI